MLDRAKLHGILHRHAAVEADLATAADRDAYARLGREHAELAPIVAKVRRVLATADDLRGVEELIADRSLDVEMRALAEAERAALVARAATLEQELRVALLPRDAADERSAILEVRAGIGGEEAALFAGDLFRMYERYAALKRWQIDILSVSEAEAGGIREIVASLAGPGVFARLKYESGVHRVQRVPQTEASGRIHTSAATVAVLPEAEDVDVAIDEKDLTIDTFRASGAGGQHVNKTDSAVRVTHAPSGIAVVVQDERSQHKNKARAMKLLRARLFDAERERQTSLRAADRRAQVGSGDRSERIRTYNFPQGRVTDHRIGLTLYRLPEILAGVGLDELVDALALDHQTKLLAAVG